MAKKYYEDIRLNAARNKIFGALNNLRYENIFDVIDLSSGDYLPAHKMMNGNFTVYGGGGITDNKYTNFNVSKLTLGIGRVGARCGCVFKIQPNSWVTDNALFVKNFKKEYELDFLIQYLNYVNLNQFANTAAQPVISLKRISSVKIPVLDLSEQKEIVDLLNQIEIGIFQFDTDKYNIKNILSSIDISIDISSALNHQQDLLKQLRQAFLREAMQGKLVPQNPDDEPATELLKKIKAEKENLVKEKKLKKEKPLPPITADETPYKIPENWAWCRLGEIAQIVRGGSPRPAGDKRFYDGDIPFLKVGDLTGYENKYCESFTHSIKEAGLHKTRFVEADTLMLTNSGATLGIPRICTFPTTFNDGIAAFLHLSINKVFLYYFLKLKSEWFLAVASRGQGQPNLNTDIIADTLLALPPLSEQQRIVDKIEEIMNITTILENNIKLSQQQNEALLQQVLREALQPQPEAFSGETIYANQSAEMEMSEA